MVVDVVVDVVLSTRRCTNVVSAPCSCADATGAAGGKKGGGLGSGTSGDGGVVSQATITSAVNGASAASVAASSRLVLDLDVPPPINIVPSRSGIGACSPETKDGEAWDDATAFIVAAAGAGAEAPAAAPSTAARIPSNNPCTRFHSRGWLLSDPGRNKERLISAAALR